MKIKISDYFFTKWEGQSKIRDRANTKREEIFLREKEKRRRKRKKGNI